MNQFTHTLIVGGTGMLYAASVELAAHSKRLTSVARTPRSLMALDDALVNSGCVHHWLPLDWNMTDHFLAEIKRHAAATEPPDLVVAWIHDDDLALKLAAELAQTSNPISFFHIVGSAAKNPKDIADTTLRRLDLPNNTIRYHQVVLGVHKSDAHTRWLTHQEVSAGVLKAIEQKQAQFIVGSLERW